MLKLRSLVILFELLLIFGFISQALHKVIRKMREEKARLQNNEANLSDILTRLLLFFIYEFAQRNLFYTFCS